MSAGLDDQGQFRQIGGARIGLFNATWPFALLKADANQVRLYVLGFPLTFPKGSLNHLGLHSALFSKGLRIEHNVPALPRFIVFWTFDYPALADGLRIIGFSVDD